MITRLTQRYKVTCDRCGKEEFCDEENPTALYYAIFKNSIENIKSGNVCSECQKDFEDLAYNFFDEVNKEKDNEQRETE